MRGSLRPTHRFHWVRRGDRKRHSAPDPCSDHRPHCVAGVPKGSPAGADVSLAKGDTNRYRGA